MEGLEAEQDSIINMFETEMICWNAWEIDLLESALLGIAAVPFIISSLIRAVSVWWTELDSWCTVVIAVLLRWKHKTFCTSLLTREPLWQSYWFCWFQTLFFYLFLFLILVICFFTQRKFFKVKIYTERNMKRHWYYWKIWRASTRWST